MTQLNRTVIASVYQSLDAGYFTHLDFDIEFPAKGDTLLIVGLTANPKYRFSIAEKTNYALEGGFHAQQIAVTTETPGSIKTIEQHSFTDLADALSRIPQWTNNIWEDLRSKTPGLREIEDIRRQLEEQMAAIKDPDEHFTRSELDELSARFEALLAKFSEMETLHKITADELDTIKGEIEKMRASAPQVPKGIWSRMAGNRFVLLCKQIATSAEGRTFLLDAAKRLLLSDDSNSSKK